MKRAPVAARAGEVVTANPGGRPVASRGLCGGGGRSRLAPSSGIPEGGCWAAVAAAWPMLLVGGHGRQGHVRRGRSAATTPPPTRTTAPRIQGQIGVPPSLSPSPSAGGAAAGAGSDAGADAGASAPAPGPGVVSVNDTSPETG